MKEPFLIFISGSVNSGKSTTSKLIADKIGAEWLDFDEIAHANPGFDLSKDIPKVIKAGAEAVNAHTDKGKAVVANYVLREEDYVALREKTYCR